MRLFRFIPAALLVIGILPSGAQVKPSTRPLNSLPQIKTPSKGTMSVCVLTLPNGTQLKGLSPKPCSEAQRDIAQAKAWYLLDKNSSCYSIRDYDFETPKGAKFPKLKSYSTCVPAARFEAKNVTSSGASMTADLKR